MTEQLISFETAKLAKEKGFFDKNIYGDVRLSQAVFYDKHGLQYDIREVFEDKGIEVELCYNAPTQSLLQRWLREAHGIYIELIIDAWVNDDCIEEPAYRAFLWQVGQPKPQPWDDLGCSNYEKILEVALQHALELINP